MRVSTSALGLEGEGVFRRLEELRLALDLDDVAWGKALGLSSSEYEKSYQNTCRRLPVASFMRVCSRFGISPDSLIYGPFDPVAVAAHYSGNHTYIPERYTRGALSKRRTMRNVLEFVERRFGPEAVAKISWQMQVPLAALEPIDAPINILFAADMFSKLKSIGVGETFFAELGRNSVVSTRSLPFLSDLSKLWRPLDVYESYLASHVHKIEKNCSYRISKVTAHGFFFESMQNGDLVEIFKNPTYGSPSSVSSRLGQSAPFLYTRICRLFRSRKRPVFILAILTANGLYQATSGRKLPIGRSISRNHDSALPKSLVLACKLDRRRFELA